MDLNDIPQDQTKNFPTGVSEIKYYTEKEMEAFLYGLNYADDIDVSTSETFYRDGFIVVRVQVGHFSDE